MVFPDLPSRHVVRIFPSGFTTTSVWRGIFTCTRIAPSPCHHSSQIRRSINKISLQPSKPTVSTQLESSSNGPSRGCAWNSSTRLYSSMVQQSKAQEWFRGNSSGFRLWLRLPIIFSCKLRFPRPCYAYETESNSCGGLHETITPRNNQSICQGGHRGAQLAE